MVLPNLIWIEANFDLKFLFRLDFTFCFRGLEDPFLFNFWVVQVPCYLVLVHVMNGDRHKFGVASIWLSDNFSFKINNRGLENEFRLDCLTQNCWGVINFDRLFNVHGNRDFVVACLFGVKFNLKVVDFFWLDD